MRTLLVLTALLVAAATADAKPRRVVVLEFDGARSLADIGRQTVLSMLGEQYDVIATKRWESARAQATGHGPQQWQQASRQVGVDAVIEGWVQDEGRHHVLTVAVREAATGQEIDSVSVKLGERGVTTEQSHQLQTQLDELLQWIDGDVTGYESTSHLPDARTIRPILGAHEAPHEDHASAREDADDGDDEDDHPARHHKHHRRQNLDRDDDRDTRSSPRLTKATRDDDSDAKPAKTDAAESSKGDSDKPRETEKKKLDTKIAAAEPPSADTNDLVKLFGPDSVETAIVSDHKSTHIARPTPRFMIGAGGYMASRGLTFDYDPNTSSPPPTYPASGITGFQVNAAIYPAPLKKIDGDLSGIGFTFSISKSVGSYLTAMDDTGYGDYTLQHTAWEAGIHYRYPLNDLITIDGEVNYGDIASQIVDLPEDIELPDTDYSYVGAGVHVDLNVTDHATIGAGFKYMYMLSTGDVSSEDWYGAGTAYGYALDGNFVIPLPANLYLRGAVEYRMEHVDFEGSGAVTIAHAVWDMVDTSITGSANVGVKF